MEPEDIDQTLEQLYNLARSASSEGLTSEALLKIDEALALLDSVGDDSEHHGYSDFMMLEGDIHWGAGDWEQAYQAYSRVAQLDPERTDARVATGVALYHLCRFTAALAVLEMASLEEPDDPEVWYYLGLCALRRGDRELAIRHFEEAAELQEDRPVPVDITPEEITELVEKMFAEIPADIRKVLENVPIILEERPSETLLYSADPPMDPTVLGLFDGVPITESGTMDVVTSPTRIILYTENIWLLTGDRATLEEELFITLKHEIGHLLGMSEEELAERGLA